MFNLKLKFMHEDVKYPDLMVDDAFKLVFGQESTKTVMIEFLNQVIDDRKIVDVDFMDKEMHPNIRDRKTSIYDLFCKTDDGSRIIVELQNRKQEWYAERMLYYSMHQVLKQVDSAQDSYDFCPIYVISILDFTLKQNEGLTNVKTVYRLLEQEHHRLLSNRLTYIFLELPKFKKTEDELDGNILEGMYFCLKNMHLLQGRPKALTHDVFDKIFDTGELIMSSDDLRTLILSKMTTERDLRNQFAYAIKTGLEEGREKGLAEGREKGLAEGRAEGRAEVAVNMLAAGMDVQQVAKLTMLTVEQVEALISRI